MPLTSAENQRIFLAVLKTRHAIILLIPAFVLKLSAVGPANGPGAISISPPSGYGESHTLSIQYTHPGGWQSLGVVNVLINNFECI